MNAKLFHKKVMAKLADKFKEDDHPRANDGKFGDKNSPTKPKKTKPKTDDDKKDKPKKKSFPKSKGPLKNDAPANNEAVTDHDFESATDAQKQAIADYGGIAYNNINRMLRGLPTPESLNEKNKARINEIDAVMSKSKLTTDKKVYRGMSGMHDLVALADQAVGTTLDVPNYWSTTQSTKVGASFSGGEGSVLFEINLKKGQSALDMERFKGTKPGSYSEEELLLPRGSKYKITGHRVVKGTSIFSIEVADGE